MNKRLLTIQDVSCLGQCSLTVALPLVSACGIETVILPSAVLSTHTGGFTGYTFRDLTDDMPLIEKSWNANGLKFDAFYTGYVCESQIDPILSIMKSCANDGAVKIVDPAMADGGKLYKGFAPDFPSKMRRLCEVADYVLPNLTEAAFLLGREPVLDGYDKPFIEDLLRSLHAMGARNVILTGVSFEPGKLGIATFDGRESKYYFNPRLEKLSHGTGDVYASVFAGALMRGFDMYAAAALAADIVCASIKATPDDHWYGVCFERAIPELVRRIENGK